VLDLEDVAGGKTVALVPLTELKPHSKSHRTRASRARHAGQPKRLPLAKLGASGSVLNSLTRVMEKSWLLAAGTAGTGQNTRLPGNVISFESTVLSFY